MDAGRGGGQRRRTWAGRRWCEEDGVSPCRAAARGRAPPRAPWLGLHAALEAAARAASRRAATGRHLRAAGSGASAAASRPVRWRGAASGWRSRRHSPSPDRTCASTPACVGQQGAAGAGSRDAQAVAHRVAAAAGRATMSCPERRRDPRLPPPGSPRSCREAQLDSMNDERYFAAPLRVHMAGAFSKFTSLPPLLLRQGCAGNYCTSYNV